ncbi:MAG: PAS domain-containing protein [Candidatus Saganbacteria bacterium]|nr:PAS domain-containing protein [Candidatus Saganbacteria bacterium]
MSPPAKTAEQKDFNRRIFAGEKVTSFETQRLTKDGRLLDVWLTATKLIDESGKVIGISATERDITERKRKEAELKASEARYRTLVENASDQIFMVNEELKFMAMNSAALSLLRKKLDEVLGKPVAEVFPKEISANNIANLEKVFKTGKGFTLDEELSFGGQRVFVNSSLSPVKNNEGKTVAALGVVRDITERKRKDLELKKKISDLEIFYKSAMDREDRILELKAKVEELKKIIDTKV